MEYKIYMLIAMMFCHIVDDYYLQGWLASAKQKSWWEKNAPDRMYEKDYKMALFMHSFSWSTMIMIVPAIYGIIFSNNALIVLLLFVSNLQIHFMVDDMKANKKLINLVQDQSIHMIQILLTWIASIACMY